MDSLPSRAPVALPDLPAFADSPERRAHARAARRITLALLLAWFVVSFGLTWFARELDFRFFGWTFSYWMAAQGSLLVYCAIAAAYAAYMNRLDRRFGIDDRA